MTLPSVCFISQEYPPDTGWGGIGAYTYEMAHALKNAGHDVVVISAAAEREGTSLEDGVEVHRLKPSPEWGRYRGLWRVGRWWPGFAWAANLRLRVLCSQRRIDVVESAEARADGFVIGLWPRRPKTVVRLHTAQVFVDRWSGRPTDERAGFFYWQERVAISRADAVSAPTRFIADITKDWLGSPSMAVSVIPNAVDADLFSPTAAPRDREVLFVGRLEGRKGVALVEAAVPQVLSADPMVRFSFLGADGADSSGRSWRERISAAVPPKHRGRLSFGSCARARLVERYRRAAVTILPSPLENCPYAVLESMACATPVVVSASGGMPELVRDGVEGLLFARDDASGLADRLSRIVRDDRLRETLGQGARRRVESGFSRKAVYGTMADFYAGVLAAA